MKDGYPGDYTREWASAGEGVGAFIELRWVNEIRTSHIALYDRPNLGDNIVAGTLTFSDGSTVAVGQLPNDGSGLNVTFPVKVVTWVRFTVTSAVGGSVGLAEFEVYGGSSGSQPTNQALSATATASSENIQTGQSASKAIDGVIGGYPGDYTREWATQGQLAGAWIQLNWSSTIFATKVVLYDRPNLGDNVRRGTLTFSDGSRVAVGQLPNDGSGLEVVVQRYSQWVRFTVDDAVGADIGLAEIQVF